MAGRRRYGVRVAMLAAEFLAASIVPSELAAQQQVATLVGSVRDSAGHPIPRAEVRLTGSDVFTHTNDSGGFRLQGLPIGTVNVTARRLGFAPASFDLRMRAGQRDSLVLTLTMIAQNLAGMVAEDEAMARSQRLLAGFWSRKSQGFGHYLTRDDIVKRDAHEFTDLVRMIPSVTVQMKNGRPTIRFPRYGQSSIRADCPPLYWVDGQRVENATPDEFPPSDMEAIEIYSGAATIPPQFAPRMSSYTCGVIVIWTRIPGQ